MEEIQLNPGEEQTIQIRDFAVAFVFNPFAKQWVFTLTTADGTVVAQNITILPGTWPLKGIDQKYDWPRVCMIDKTPESPFPINPLLDFGSRLGIFEITQG